MYGVHQEPGSQGPYAAGSAVPRGRLHDGVRSFMNGVYLWMAAGLAVTGAVAWGISSSQQAMMAIWLSPMRWVLMIGTFVMAIGLQKVMERLSFGAALAGFMAYSGAMGAMLSYVPMLYPVGNIAGVLAATVGMFGGMAAFGYFTKKDLSGIGQFLVMALLGSIIASLINGFVLQSGGMSMVIYAVVAAISAGLTAYYTQAVKQMYLVRGGQGNLALLGALVLYINFINLFLSLLRLFGGSRD